MTENQHENSNEMVSKSGCTIYRMSWRSDRWGCRSCSKTYDKWGMIDHTCSKYGRRYTEPPSGAAGYHTAHKAVDNKFRINTKMK
jgi:hypothetical protein